MDLADLNRRVTDAITLAEALSEGSAESMSAFGEVMRLEESIARTAPADSLEGELARLGAVAAALRARQHLRALQLGELYLAESPADDVSARLAAMIADAQAQIDDAEDPTVEPVRFRLPTAA